MYYKLCEIFNHKHKIFFLPLPLRLWELCGVPPEDFVGEDELLGVDDFEAGPDGGPDGASSDNSPSSNSPSSRGSPSSIIPVSYI